LEKFVLYTINGHQSQLSESKMFWSAVFCALFCASATLGQDPTTPAGVPTTTAAGGPVTTTPANAGVVAPVVHAENVKLASKDWRNYKGCEDTCFSLCLEKPTEYNSKCSVLFSNATLVNIPATDSCKKADIIRDCTYQCQCACKRCGFCKQELVNKCADNMDHTLCFDNVLTEIIQHAKCD
jgi:hypothetical protein